MMTATKYSVSWSYQAGSETARRSLHSYNIEPCVEAARLLAGNPYTFDINVIETDTGISVPWKPDGIGRVVYK